MPSNGPHTSVSAGLVLVFHLVHAREICHRSMLRALAMQLWLMCSPRACTYSVRAAAA